MIKFYLRQVIVMIRYNFKNKRQSLSFIIPTMQLKIKENCPTHTNSNKYSLSPAPIKHKIKHNPDQNTKSIKIQKQISVVPIKTRHHQPSKSSIQNSEHKHYNSPNSGITSLSELRLINQFTFTQLLQKNAKKQPICSSGASVLQIQQLQPINSSEYLQYRDPKMKKSILTGRDLTQTSASFYYEANPIHIQVASEDEIHKQAHKIDSEGRKQRNISNNKSVSKSPMRLTNAHKLNNTPKVKQKSKRNKQSKAKKQSKTFTSVLNSESIEKTGHSKKESINLLCSEKIYKFIQDNHEDKIPQSNLSLKHKSNLLSTGVINLSQPLERTQQLNHLQTDYRREIAKSKSIFTERHDIKEFEDEEVTYNPQELDCFRSSIDQLQARLEEIKTYLTNKVEFYDQNSFCQKICQNFNPQISKTNISHIATKLTKISTKLQQNLEEIIIRLQDFSTKITTQIQNQIKILGDSKQSLIDWTTVQKQLQEKHQFQKYLTKTQVFSLRLGYLKQSVLDNIENGQEQVQFNHVNELRKIDAEIQQQISSLDSLDNKKLSNSQVDMIGQPILLYFQDKANQLQTLFSSIEEILTF